MPNMLNNLLKDIFIISVSGSLLALCLMIIKPFIHNKLNAGWYYYIWLIVAVRLIIPFGLPVNIAGISGTGIIDSTMLEESKLLNDIVNLENARPQTSTNVLLQPYIYDNKTNNYEQGLMTAKLKEYLDYRTVLPYIGLIWLIVCAALFVKKLINYYVFVRFVKAGSNLIDDDAILDTGYFVCKLLKIKKEVPVYSNKAVASPMIIGIIKPVIVLPDMYIQNTLHLKYVFMHELIHYKRLDIYYKWLIQTILCVHWFNPIFYFAGREINKACELSCDEAIIKRLTYKEQRDYGDTLLQSFEMASCYKRPAVSLTLTENSKFMKKRLGAIMRYRKKPKYVTCLSALLTLILCTGAMFTGVYAETPVKMKEAEILTAEKSLSVFASGLQTKQSEVITYGSVYLNEKEVRGTEIESWEGNGKIIVKNYGHFYLTKEEPLHADINWDGDGAVMLLYTKENLSTADILRLADEGILPLDANNKIINDSVNIPRLTSNLTYVQNNRELKLNFTTSPNKPLQWSTQIPETGEYYFYIIATGDTGITDIKSDIAFSAEAGKSTSSKSESALPTIWMPGRLTKDQLPENLFSWIAECDKEKNIYITSNNDMWYVYCNLITDDYAIEMDNVSKSGITIGLYDITRKEGDGYALLSIPRHYGNIKVMYKDVKAELNQDSLFNENYEIYLKNKNAYNISESGSFQAEDGQILTLRVISDIKGGTVDLFIFDPDSREQRFEIGSTGFTEEIKLTKGVWQYNCSGIFKDGGTLHITGKIK